MFVVTEAEATAIRTAFEQQGELSAAIELRRLLANRAAVPYLVHCKGDLVVAQSISWTPFKLWRHSCRHFLGKYPNGAAPHIA